MGLLAEGGHGAALGETVHTGLDRGLDLAVDLVDVGLVVGLVGVGVEMDRREQLRADLAGSGRCIGRISTASGNGKPAMIGIVAPRRRLPRPVHFARKRPSESTN